MIVVSNICFVNHLYVVIQTKLSNNFTVRKTKNVCSILPNKLVNLTCMVHALGKLYSSFKLLYDFSQNLMQSILLNLCTYVKNLFIFYFTSRGFELEALLSRGSRLTHSTNLKYTISRIDSSPCNKVSTKRDSLYSGLRNDKYDKAMLANCNSNRFRW